MLAISSVHRRLAIVNPYRRMSPETLERLLAQKQDMMKQLQREMKLIEKMLEEREVKTNARY